MITSEDTGMSQDDDLKLILPTLNKKITFYNLLFYVHVTAVVDYI